MHIGVIVEQLAIPLTLQREAQIDSWAKLCMKCLSRPKEKLFKQ